MQQGIPDTQAGRTPGSKKPSKPVVFKGKCRNPLEYAAQAIEGNGTVERLILSENGTRKKKELSVQGVFIAVGIQPETKAFEGIVNMEQGYIKAEEEGITSAPGIFAAGDARTKKLRQIVTAAADGANAVTSAEQYLSDLKRG